MSETSSREFTVFSAALELPADQRGAFLDQACAGDVRAPMAEPRSSKQSPTSKFTSLVDVNIQSSGTNLLLAWPAAASSYSVSAYQLHSTTNLASTNWMNVTNPVSVTNGQYQVMVPQPARPEFYRLQLQ